MATISLSARAYLMDGGNIAALTITDRPALSDPLVIAVPTSDCSALMIEEVTPAGVAGGAQRATAAGTANTPCIVAAAWPDPGEPDRAEALSGRIFFTLAPPMERLHVTRWAQCEALVTVCGRAPVNLVVAKGSEGQALVGVAIRAGVPIATLALPQESGGSSELRNAAASRQGNVLRMTLGGDVEGTVHVGDGSVSGGHFVTRHEVPVP